MRGSLLCAAIVCGALCCAAPITNAIEPDLTEKQLQTAGFDEGAIEPERLSALIARASEAATTVQQARMSKSEPRSTSNAFRIDAAIKAAARELLVFQNYLLELGLPGAERPIKWPKWVFEPPTDKTPPQVLKARMDWLNANVFPMTDPVCKLASEQTDDHLVCSVE
jgi:hypothetical protein